MHDYVAVINEHNPTSLRYFQYLISGSDDFNLYVWRIPAEPTDGKAASFFGLGWGVSRQCSAYPSLNAVV